MDISVTMPLLLASKPNKIATTGEETGFSLDLPSVIFSIQC